MCFVCFVVRACERFNRMLTLSLPRSKSEFETAIKENKVVVLDAFATWCAPCKVIAPQVAKSVAHLPLALSLYPPVLDPTWPMYACTKRHVSTGSPTSSHQPTSLSSTLTRCPTSPRSSASAPCPLSSFSRTARRLPRSSVRTPRRCWLLSRRLSRHRLNSWVNK